MFDTNAHIADRFAQIEAEFKALKTLYEKTKAEALGICMAECTGDSLSSFVEGEMFGLDFSLTPVNSFSLKKAQELGFITDEQVALSKVQTSRQNLTPKLLTKTRVFK